MWTAKQSALCRLHKTWDHKADFLFFQLCSRFSVCRAPSFILLPWSKTVSFIKARGLSQNRETHRSWDFRDHKVKHHIGIASASAAFVPVPLAEWQMASTPAFSETTKTFQILPIAHHRAWCLTAKSTSWVPPNKNNLSDRVLCLQIAPISAQKLEAQSQGQMKPVPRAQVSWMLTSCWFIVAIFACPEL